MEKLKKRLIKECKRRSMDESREELARADATYNHDLKDEAELDQRYERLSISREQRMVIDDYIACTATVNHRYAEISYVAGIRDAVAMLVSLGLIKHT